MACKNCSSLNVKRQFATTGEVSKFIRKLRSLVDDGKLTEFPPLPSWKKWMTMPLGRM